MSDFLSDEEKLERIAQMRQQAQERREFHKDGKYMSVKDSIDDFKYAFDAREKATAGAKIVGKSLFNVGRFALAELLPSMLETAADNGEKSIKNKK